MRDKLGRFVKGVKPHNYMKKMPKELKDKMEKEVYSKRRGKSYEEIYGKEKAEEILNLQKKSFTKERRKSIILKRKGMKLTEEHKNNISLGNIGKIIREETKDKIRRKLIGHKVSEITREKISATKQEVDLDKWNKFISIEPYDEKFNESFRKLIRKRDNQVCMLCGIHREKLNRALDVHHINYDKLLTIPENCISLCNGCHMRTNYNRKYWINFFQSLLSERYGYNYSTNKEIILNLEVNHGVD